MLARSSHVRAGVEIRIPSRTITSVSKARTVWPTTPSRRTGGRFLGLLRWSSRQSRNQVGSQSPSTTAAVRCEIQAPGVAAESALARPRISKSHPVGRYSNRPADARSEERSRPLLRLAARASWTVNGANERLNGRGKEGRLCTIVARSRCRPQKLSTSPVALSVLVAKPLE